MPQGPWPLSEPLAIESSDPGDAGTQFPESGEASDGDGHDMSDALLVNLEKSISVHTTAHFFGWTQGLLQGLIRHDVLICVLQCDGEPQLRAAGFSIVTPNPGVFAEAFLKDAAARANLIRAWEARRRRPVICEVGDDLLPASGALGREFERAATTELLVHGTHDADGRTESLFIFAGPPAVFGAQQAQAALRVVPFMYAAWVRTFLKTHGELPSGNEPVSTQERRITPRETEILKWIYFGKSNLEIGTILDISPLTVKNHVQKILRKLNVVNRAQAIGKALELRILRP